MQVQTVRSLVRNHQVHRGPAPRFEKDKPWEVDVQWDLEFRQLSWLLLQSPPAPGAGAHASAPPGLAPGEPFCDLVLRNAKVRQRGGCAARTPSGESLTGRR